MIKKKIISLSIIGFLFGFVGTFLSTFGLVLFIAEILSMPFLAPARIIYQVFSSPTSFSILLLALINGIIYTLIFLLVYYITIKVKKSKPLILTIGFLYGLSGFIFGFQEGFTVLFNFQILFSALFSGIIFLILFWLVYYISIKKPAKS